MIKRMPTIALCLFLAMTASGCDMFPAKKVTKKRRVKAVRKKVTKNAKPPVEKVEEKYAYTSDKLPDPFQSFLNKPKKRNEDNATLSPLQKMELDKLKIVGILIGMDEPGALVRGTNGQLYTLKTGTKVGKNNGVVIDVNEQFVVVEENYVDILGKKHKNIREIQAQPAPRS